MSTRNRRNCFISLVFCAWRNSAREFQGHGCKWPTPRSSAGSFAPRLDTKLTNFGKLSSNGPCLPFGYQMKWPMPSDAKSSPWFHEVRPEIVPPHSFCQTLFPTFKASLFESAKACAISGQTAISAVAITANGKPPPQNRWHSCFLDVRHLSISVRLSAATNLKLERRGNTIL